MKKIDDKHNNSNPDQLLTQAQVAKWIGMSEAWLEQCRFRKTGLPWIKIGRSCRYEKSAVAKWLEAHTVVTEQ